MWTFLTNNESPKAQQKQNLNFRDTREKKSSLSPTASLGALHKFTTFQRINLHR